MTLRNQSHRTISITINRESGPPYLLNGDAFEVLSDGQTDWRLSGGAHGIVSGLHLHVGAGDEAELVGIVYGLEPNDYSREIQVSLRDQTGNEYPSALFRPCAQTGS